MPHLNEKNSVLVFVYGTLKRGFYLHREMEMIDAEFVREDAITGSLYNCGWFPAYSREGDTRVQGEVYRVHRFCIDHLDAVEGCPHLYRRRLVETESGLRVNVYEYARPTETLEPIPEGVFTHAHQDRVRNAPRRVV